MARGPTYRVPFRRRREGKTDYRRRLKLLISRKYRHRVVIRKSNKYIQIQLIFADTMGDKTIVSTISSELKKYGYEGGTCNIPAAYLTGLLFGKKVKREGIEEGILDIGLHSSSGARVYAALRGAIDAGIRIPHEPSVFPEDRCIRGEHMAQFSHSRKHFSISNFGTVKEKIMTDDGDG